MTDKYSDGVLDIKFQAIEEKMDDHFDALTRVLSDIKEQTTKTNGTVAAVKTEQAQSKGFVRGIATVGGLITVIFLGLFSWAGIQIIANSNHIAALSAVIKTLTH